MKHTFTVGTCRYTVRVVHGADQIRAKVKQSGLTWDEVTEDVLLADRVAEVTAAALKKPRKPTVRAGSRTYPKRGAGMSTAVYVHKYHLANANRFRHADVWDWVEDFYQPLSEHVTVAQGEYSEEPC